MKDLKIAPEIDAELIALEKKLGFTKDEAFAARCLMGLQVHADNYMTDYKELIEAFDRLPDGIGKVVATMPTDQILNLLNFPVHQQIEKVVAALTKELEARGYEVAIEKITDIVGDNVTIIDAQS